MTERVKVTLNLTLSDVEVLESLAAELGVTKTAVLRTAIATEKFIRDVTAQGGKILIQDGDGTTRQLIFR